MKSFVYALLLVVMISGAAPGFAQIRKIPAEATEALKSKYPQAKNVSWSDKLTSFIADFEIGNDHYRARFSSKGEWQKTDKTLDKESLPASLKDGFSKSKYADWEIKSAHLISLPGDSTQYVIVAFKSGLQKKNLLFSDKGQLLKDNYTL